MTITIIILLIALFVFVLLPVRDVGFNVPSADLSGYRFQASKPNSDGLCTFKIFNKAGVEIAHTDVPGTLDEAVAMAGKFVAEMENES